MNIPLSKWTLEKLRSEYNNGLLKDMFKKAETKLKQAREIRLPNFEDWEGRIMLWQKSAKGRASIPFTLMIPPENNKAVWAHIRPEYWIPIYIGKISDLKRDVKRPEFYPIQEAIGYKRVICNLLPDDWVVYAVSFECALDGKSPRAVAQIKIDKNGRERHLPQFYDNAQKLNQFGVWRGDPELVNVYYAANFW